MNVSPEKMHDVYVLIACCWVVVALVIGAVYFNKWMAWYNGIMRTAFQYHCAGCRSDTSGKCAPCRSKEVLAP